MKKLWLIGILIVSLFFLACSGQFETTISLAEDEEISGSFGSYDYYLQVTKIDKKNHFCYLNAYLSSSSSPDTEQMVLDKENPVKISGFTASLVGIRESFTGDKCLIKVSNRKEKSPKLTGAAVRAPPPKPRTATTPVVTTSRTTSATPAQPAAAPRATPAQPATSSRATPATPPSRASSATATTPSRTGAPTGAPRAGAPATPTVPATPATPTPRVTTTPAPTPAAPTPTSTAAPRAETPVVAPTPTVPAQPATTAQPAAPQAPLAQCRDKIDNDGDGKIDYPADLGCTSANDNDETDPVTTQPAAPTPHVTTTPAPTPAASATPRAETPVVAPTPTVPATPSATAAPRVETPTTPTVPATPATPTPYVTTTPTPTPAASVAPRAEPPVVAPTPTVPVTPSATAAPRAGAPATTTPTPTSTAAPRAGAPTTPSVTTTPAQPTAGRTGTTTTPTQPTTSSRAGAPSTTSQPATDRATTTPTLATAGRTGTPTTLPQPGTATRAGTPTQPVTAVPRTTIANATSPASRTTSAQTALAVSECADKIDNDNDGFIDWPNDPDCTDRKGASEGVKPEILPEKPVEGAPAISQCSDGVDNDGDGLIDYDQELVGCETPEDDDETDSIGETMEKTEEETAPPALQCVDGVDNDGDGLIDYAGGDPGCSGEADSSEEDYIPEEPSGGGGISAAPSALAPSEAPSVQEAPPEELPPEEQPTEEKKSEAQQTVAESTVIGKAEKTIERLTKGETIVVDTSHIIPEIKSVEMTARKEVHGAAFKIEKTEKSVIPPPTLKNIISTFHIEGPESDKVIDIKVELSKYTAKTTANCFDTKHNKWRPGKVKEKKSDEKYVYLKVALPCRN